MSRDVVDTFAYNEYWLWNDTIKASESNPYEVIYQTEDEKNIIHYIEDHLLGVHYLLLRGEQLDELTKIIHSKLEVFKIQELFELISKETSIPDLIQYIYFVAVASPSNFKDDYYENYRELLFDINENVKLAAIGGLGYIEWKEFREDLVKVFENDESKKVRASAETMIKGIDLLL
ncbi:hypothetical protein FHK87_18435 [Aquimarina algicola]|uniref:HEAT repeat domain-containing protein n=2 Tax=Aquimarina algicola TaxID=2589995 RepID=A0A504J8R2_9FLAO|nr:hypothetical protein FHK87_18435 [Aquimarina algicola]